LGTYAGFFYDNDFIILTSLLLRTQSVSSVVFFYNSQVLKNTASYEKREQVQ